MYSNFKYDNYKVNLININVNFNVSASTSLLKEVRKSIFKKENIIKVLTGSKNKRKEEIFCLVWKKFRLRSSHKYKF